MNIAMVETNSNRETAAAGTSGRRCSLPITDQAASQSQTFQKIVGDKEIGAIPDT